MPRLLWLTVGSILVSLRKRHDTPREAIDHDAVECLVQCLLYHFGVGFAALQQVNDLLELILYLVHQKIGIIVVLIHLVQQFVIRVKCFAPFSFKHQAV